MRGRRASGMKYPIQRLGKARINHRGRLEPVLRRRTSSVPSWTQELERYAFPKTIVNGTILERLLAKRLHELGYSYYFQYVVDLPQLATARLDFAVWGTGIGGARGILGIEPEGELWHIDIEHDLERKLQLEAAGIQVVQLWEADMLASKERMYKVIDDALRGIEAPRPPRTARARPNFS